MRGNDQSVTLFVFGTLLNREQFLSELESGYDVRIVQRLCPGMQKKGQVNNSIYITSGRQEGDTQQNKTSMVQLANGSDTPESVQPMERCTAKGVISPVKQVPVLSCPGPENPSLSCTFQLQGVYLQSSASVDL